MADTIPNVDRNLSVWAEILRVAVDNDDTAGELEALDELDRLLDLRLHLPQPRHP